MDKHDCIFVKDKLPIKGGKKAIIRVCLRYASFTETEIFLLKILQIKVKINWNSTARPMNSIKKYNKTYK